MDSDYDSTSRYASMGERQPLVENQQQWEWWERPSEAVGVTQHIQMDDTDYAANPSGLRHKEAVDDEDIETLDLHQVIPRDGHEHKKLGAFLSTAISGNDITSSVLYVSGYAASVCGIWAPVALILVSALLALFRPIYTEVVTALPMNGGTYNVLLNTTSKNIASVAGALSMLSYVATAVVSSTSAALYLQQEFPCAPIFWIVIIILGIFCLLNLLGITESAVVAVILFVAHCTTLMGLIFLCTWAVIDNDFEILKTNWQSENYQKDHPGLMIYLGFGASMLGITGFETSANFVEEQKPGVFPKTLTNMWIAVAFFNPVISILSFGVLPICAVVGADSSYLLSSMAKVAGTQLFSEAAGKWFERIVIFDAVCVLSGSVLTAYVGVIGISRRLALDRIMPQFLLSENKLRKTNHWIIVGFFLLCSSLFTIVAGGQYLGAPCANTSSLPPAPPSANETNYNPNNTDYCFSSGGSVSGIDALSGVYTAAFLCVMSMFAVGNMLLKYKRSKLPRELITPWPIVIIALAGVVAAFVSNLVGNPAVIPYFVAYFGGTMLFFVAMFLRIRILKIIIFFLRKVTWSRRISKYLAKRIQGINSSKVIFFTRDDNIALMNKAILYIRDNEQTNWILMVHVHSDERDIPPKMEEHCKILDQAYPKFRIDYISVKGEFGPKLIDQLSTRLEVPKNFMFLTTPSGRFGHKVSDFGGVRLVTH